MIDRDLLPQKQFLIMNDTESSFINVGESHLNYFRKALKLRNDANILEIGSGNGRIARALSTFLDNGTYTGLEIMKPFVDWCAEAYKKYPNFTFKHIDVYNLHYNPGSSNKAKDFRFPYESGTFDFIFMTSVFTHMRRLEVENYLKEVQRMLKEGGTCFITYFIVNDETQSLISSGKSMRKFQQLDEVSYTDNPRIPEKAIAYREDYLFELYKRCKLKIIDGNPVYGVWRNPQKLRMTVKHSQDRISAKKCFL